MFNYFSVIMVTPEEIDMIVSTYTLPRRVESYARGRALYLLKNGFVWTFEAIYECIDQAVSEKVDDYSNPEGMHLPVLRLRPDEGLGFMPAMPEMSDEDNEALPNRTSAESIRELMIKAGEEKTAEMIEQLFSGNENATLTGVPQDKLLERASEAAQRLAIISERYSLGGRIIMPARDVTYVDLGRRRVVFRQRRFSGDPFKFYLNHPEVYAGLFRGELKRLDPSLYGALVATGDIKKVPRKNRELGNPALFLEEHPGDFEGMTRWQFGKTDTSLYNKLVAAGQIDAVPRKNRIIGDALAYFRSHPEDYKGMGRFALARYDRSLYEKLRASGQLGRAIPEKLK